MNIVVNGPEFLLHPSDKFFPPTPSDAGEDNDTEVEVSSVNVLQNVSNSTCPDEIGISQIIDPKKFSSFQHLQRVTCYVRRFIQKLKQKVGIGEKNVLPGVPWLLHW